MKNKEITIIGLLNRIYNNNAPEKIKYYDKIYTYIAEEKMYYDEGEISLWKYYNGNILNDKVEILPEEQDEWEDIKEINSNADNTLFTMECYTGIPEKAQDWNFNIFKNKINQLIKNQKYLKERLDKDELK